MARGASSSTRTKEPPRRRVLRRACSVAAIASSWRLVAVATAVVLLATACPGRDGDRDGAGLPAPGGASADGGDEVQVDLRARHQVIDGFGASTRPWTDPHLADAATSEVPPDAQDQILDALITDLGLTRLRPILVPPAQETAAGQPSTGDDRDQIELVRQAGERGLRTFFPAPVGLAPWMRQSPERYVEWALGTLLRWRDNGMEPPFFSPVNEPAHNRAGDLSPQWLVEVVSLLGPRMRDAGLGTTLVIPDDLNPGVAYDRSVAVLEDPEARPFVGALAYHLYPGGGDRVQGLLRMRELGQRYDLPVWMTEYSQPSYAGWPGALQWARTMHQLLTVGDVAAVDYLWAFFGSQDRAHTLVSMRMEDGQYREHSLQPVYYLTGQFSRFVRPGCVRVDAPSGQDDVLTSAFSCPGEQGDELVVVAVNLGQSAKAMTFSLTGGDFVGEVRAVRTGEEERGEALEPLTAAPGSFQASLPATTVTTFVARVTEHVDNSSPDT